MDGPISSSPGGSKPASGDGESKVTIFPAEKRAFGFCPMEFADEVAGAFEGALKAAIGSEEKATLEAFKRKFGDSNQAQDLSSLMWQRLRAAFKRASDRNLDRFELYVFRNIFILPKDFCENDDPKELAAPTPVASVSEEDLDKELAFLAAKKKGVKKELSKLQKRSGKYRKYRDYVKKNIAQLQASVKDIRKLSSAELSTFYSELKDVLERTKAQKAKLDKHSSAVAVVDAEEHALERRHKRQKRAFGNVDEGTIRKFNEQ